jgi:triphosphoribosyl-dephospho-CoA synthase
MRADLELAFVDACLLDVTALKPGNVGLHAGGHGMQPVDFIRSAEAAAPAIAQPAGCVGERIHRAIVATHEAVGTNTNLGIVLLAAPIAHAASGPPGREALVTRLRACLARLTVEDARLAFEAIRLARPGGLGTADRHDVHAPARVSLLEAMREAAGRDLIARQYANGYADVLDTGLARLAAARARGRDWRWTTTEVYLAFLARHPDSHVARKFGAGEAAVLRDAAAARDRAAARANSVAVTAAAIPLIEWDGELKARGLNPGTSADLTVATLFLAFLGAEASDCAHRGQRRGASERVGAFPTG